MAYIGVQNGQTIYKMPTVTQPPKPAIQQPTVQQPVARTSSNSPLLQMQPITLSPETYKDPRAGILYGGGNKSISDAEIRNFISNAKSDDEIMRAALQYNVSADQISRAMGGQSTGQNRFDMQNITNYLDKQGVSRDKNPAQTLDLAQILPPELLNPPPPVVAPQVTPTPVQLNNQTDMVEDRLNNLLSNPNSPLLQRAQAMAAQASNRRGLLNSSIGVSAGQSALTDAALQIATPDANARVGAAMQNAQQANQVGLQNAQNSLTAGMFNNDMYAKLGMFNNEMQFKAGAFNAEQVNAIMGKHLDNNNRINLAEIEAKYQRDLQGSASSAKLFSDVMQLVTHISTSDLPAEAKQGNIDNLFRMLDMGLSLNNSFAGMGLDRMFASNGSTTQSGGILNQLSGGQINPAQQPVANNATTQSNTDGNISLLTGEPLGASRSNPQVFNTIGGQMPTPVVNAIKQIYGDQIDPRFIISEEQISNNRTRATTDPNNLGNRTFDPFAKMSAESAKRLQEGVRNGTVMTLDVRDPQYGMPFTPELGWFAQGHVYYDPNNVAGLAA